MDKETTNLIINALRALWRNRGKSRKDAKEKAKIEWIEGRSRVGYVCSVCGKKMREKENGKCPFDIHHLVPVRSGDFDINSPDWNLFIYRLFLGDVVLCCKNCHRDYYHPKKEKVKPCKKKSTTSSIV